MSEDDGVSLSEEIKSISLNQEAIMTQLADESIKRVKKKQWKLPFGIRMKARKGIKRQKILCIWLGSNKVLDFKIVQITGGIIQVGKYQYKPYETGAIFHYKKMPVCVALEWRMTLVGGQTDWDNAKTLNVGDFAQQTILRAIEKFEIDKEAGKAKRKFPVVWLVVALGIVIYLITKSVGGV